MLKYVFLFLLLITACKKQEKPCTLSDEILMTPLNLEIERMEILFFDSVDQDLDLFLEDHGVFVRDFLQESAYENRDELLEELNYMRTDESFQELYGEVMTHFSDISEIERDLENAFRYIKYYYPEFKVPRVYTFVSGFSSDIFINEEILVIGLDYFLPASHRFQPTDLPQYIAERYQKDYLVPNIVMAISSRFNKSDLKDKTLLAEMIYYGKAYHFTKSILPCVKDEYIIGYTNEEIMACYANEEMIWTHFIENELLFITNPFDVRKYTGEAPFTDAISPDAPGRIGRWLGWNIVDDYRFNKNVTLQELMADTDADKIFRQSGYKPRL
uniref:gliding motility lipoprotein GldB n=1 Tax=Pararhodonellum marinum TaxID=2755358 RepID=UPI00188DFE91|nr:gliding motility lipoprotein GldB [Pararhodonellum marinum]